MIYNSIIHISNKLTPIPLWEFSSETKSHRTCTEDMMHLLVSFRKVTKKRFTKKIFTKKEIRSKGKKSSRSAYAILPLL